VQFQIDAPCLPMKVGFQKLAPRSPRKLWSGCGQALQYVVNRTSLPKQFDLTIENDHFEFARSKDHITAQAALDGIYVIAAASLTEVLDWLTQVSFVVTPV